MTETAPEDKRNVCHRPDGLEESGVASWYGRQVCHRPDGLEAYCRSCRRYRNVCHRPDGLEVHYDRLLPV